MNRSVVPMRRCIGCMTSYPKSGLIRLTCEGDRPVIDRDGRYAGRGVYLCRNAECVEKARKNRAFNRSYKKNFEKEVTDAVLDEVLAELKEVVDD